MSTHDELPNADRSPACASCATLHARRDFVRTLAASAAGALLAMGASPGVAHALGVELIRPSRRSGDQTTYPVPAGDGVSIDKDNEVILARYRKLVFAFALSCPHQNTALHWLDKDECFQCPKHKSRYQPDGVFIEGRATRGMDRYAIHRDGDKVVVELDQLFEQDKDAAGWAAAQVVLP